MGRARGVVTQAEVARDPVDSDRHALSLPALLQELASASEGLSQADAERRVARFGPNELPQESRRSRLLVVLDQFKSPLIYLLLVAVALALMVREYTDALVISIVVCLNATVGAIQEGRAERAMDAIRKLARTKSRVLRDGKERIVDARELVVGDVVVLSSGDAVPADARVLEASSLRVTEAALTGESVPVSKLAGVLAADTMLAERSNMVYSGTHVVHGRGRALVVATGLRAEIGRIASLTRHGNERQTPLARRLEVFGKTLVWAGMALFASIVAIGLVSGIATVRIVMIAISQTVGMIPEGLPVVMTIALALGMQRMAGRGVIIRRLSAVDQLGAATVICTDKTGTLTRNEMTVAEVELPGEELIHVTGVGYTPEGRLAQGGRAIDAREYVRLAELCQSAVACNDASLQRLDGEWQTAGDPTEIALLTLAVKAGFELDGMAQKLPRTGELPFDPETKIMLTEHGERVFLKGAPEAVLALTERVRTPEGVAALDEPGRETLRQSARRMAERGLRVLALASGSGPLREDGGLAGRHEFTLLGFVGQLDPPREDAEPAIARARRAGIRTVMITGDHEDTALALARRLGMARSAHEVLHGSALTQLSDVELGTRLTRIAVFARVRPEDKLRIVEVLQSSGDIVVMTGDGVNDAPALSRADVGVAMGRGATEVAKQASKVIVTDDSFGTIVQGISEGRIIYANVQRAVTVLLASGFAEVAVLMLSMAFGFEPPFTAVQILWNNLVTEGTITTGLAAERGDGEEMARSPIDPRAPILSRAGLSRVLWLAFLIALPPLGWFVFRMLTHVDAAYARSETFTLLAICEWFNVLSCRSATQSIFSRRQLPNRWLWLGLASSVGLQLLLLYTPFMQRIFQLAPLTASELWPLLALGSSVLWLEEARKWLRRRARADRGHPAIRAHGMA